MNKYKYFILGSLSEGLPKVLLEAMSCGMICFVNNIPAIQKIIENNYNGIILSNINNKEVKSSLKYLNNKNELLISNNSIKYINQNHSVESFIHKEINIFKNLYK